MAETGFVVVTAPSSHRITTGGKGSDQTYPPLQPIHETNKHACNNDNSTNANTVNSANYDTNPNKQNINTAFTTLNIASNLDNGQTSAQQKSHTITIKLEPENSSTACNVPNVESDSETSSHPSRKSSIGNEILTIIGDQVARVEEEEKKIECEKNTREIEETIIENFAIRAFASWEDLQDEINERIALERANQIETATNQLGSYTNTSQPNKKKRSRPKIQKTTTNADRNQDVSGSQIKPPKPKKRIRLDKKPRDRHKKSSPDVRPESSNPLDRSEATPGTTNGKKAGNSVKKRISNKESSSDGGNKSIKKPSKATSDDKSVIRSENTSNQTKSSDTATTNGTHANSKTPNRHSTLQVHPNDLGKQMNHDQGIRDTNSTSRVTPYSPYGNNPHLNRLYDITAQADQSMQQRSYPSNFHEQFSQQPQPPPPRPHMQQHQQPKLRNSQPQPINKSNVQPPPQQQQQQQQPTGVHQNPYHQSKTFMYPQLPPPPPPHTPQSQQQSSPSMTQGNPYQHPYYPMHYPNPYYYAPPSGSSTTNGPAQSPYPSTNGYAPIPPPPGYLIHQLPSRSPYPYSNQYQSPSHPQPQPQHQYQSQYSPHPGMWYPGPPHVANPFSMYPPQQPHQQQVISSTSRSMTAAPNPYGSPYIVTESTISRQTSIMPPTPTALEQAAASSVASRFGHHPSLVHSMNHYSPSATAAAAAAAAANYPGFHSHWPPSPAPSASPASSSSSSLTAKAHVLQRWPQIFDPDHRPKQTPPLSSNGQSAYMNLRPPPPTFPVAAMFPPGPQPQPY